MEIEKAMRKIRSLEAKLEFRVQELIFENGKSFLGEITDLYFKPKSFEKKGKIYEKLGIRYVQKTLMGTLGKWFRKKTPEGLPLAFYLIGRMDSESLINFERGTRIAELIHAPLAIWNIYGLNEYLQRRDYATATVFGLALLVNSSSSMLQRYHRARICDILDRREKSRPFKSIQ